jgi:hypothetical protein
MYQVLCETLIGAMILTDTEDRDEAYRLACALQARGKRTTVIDTLGLPVWEPGPVVCRAHLGRFYPCDCHEEGGPDDDAD